MYFQVNETKFNLNLDNYKDYKNISIKSYRNNYEVIFNNDNNLNDLLHKIYQIGDHIIIDSKVHKLYDCYITKNIHLIDATENNKNIYKSLEIINKLFNNNFNKSNKLIVVGGGIIQDISSFAAAIYKRGIKMILIPTTLLAMCDSCIGAKTALNNESAKNQLGLFYAPHKVYINNIFLKTLSIGDIKSGLGEIIKLFLIGGEFFMKKLENLNIHNIHENLNDLIYNALLIKKTVIEHDEFDKNERNALNYGHTIGHILEVLSDYKIPHGISVFMGMKIVNKLFNHSCKYIDNINNFMVDEYNLDNLNKEKFKKLLLNDKKVKNNHIMFIVVEKYGYTTFKKIEINDELINKIISYI